MKNLKVWAVILSVILLVSSIAVFADDDTLPKLKRDKNATHFNKDKGMSIADMKAKIEEMVTSGNITREDADAKIAAIDKRYEEFKTKLAKMVEEGKLTQEQADEAIAGGKMNFGFGGGMPGKAPNGELKDRPMTDKGMSIADMKAKIEEMVTSGNITREDADAKIAAIDKRYEEFKTKLAKMVEEGKLTQEQADEAIAGGKMNFGFGGKMSGKAPNGELKDRPMTDKGMTIADMKAKIEEMVTSGNITREDADAKIAEIDKRYEEFKTKLAKMVEEGKLTQEQADEAIAGGKMNFGFGGGMPGKAPNGELRDRPVRDANIDSENNQEGGKAKKEIKSDIGKEKGTRIKKEITN